VLDAKIGGLVKRKFDDDVEVFKYIQYEYICSLFEKKELYFRQIIKWPDMMEGFLDNIVSPKTANLRYGSCWTLHQGVAQIVDEARKERAISEIRMNGVDSMWRTYCPNGGIRIKTTIGKIRAQIRVYCEKNSIDFDDGMVVYEHHADARRSQIDELCFSKSPNFYTDDEYRFIVTSDGPKGDGFSLVVDNVALFVDEVLISPIFPDDIRSRFISRCIHEYMECIPNTEFSLASCHDHKNLIVRRSCLYGKSI